MIRPSTRDVAGIRQTLALASVIFFFRLNGFLIEREIQNTAKNLMPQNHDGLGIVTQ